MKLIYYVCCCLCNCFKADTVALYHVLILSNYTICSSIAFMLCAVLMLCLLIICGKSANFSSPGPPAFVRLIPVLILVYLIKGPSIDKLVLVVCFVHTVYRSSGRQWLLQNTTLCILINYRHLHHHSMSNNFLSILQISNVYGGSVGYWQCGE